MCARVFSLAATSICFVTLARGIASAVAPLPGSPAGAASPAPVASPSTPPAPRFERLSLHAQATDTQQYHGAFPAAYSGPQSLSSNPETAKTVDATVFLGARLGTGTEFYVNEEVDQGYGLGKPATAAGLQYNGTLGVAGFISAEAYKIGSDSSYGRVQRIFLRHTFDLGGDAQPIDPDINQLGGVTTARHLILTAGKFGVTDVFDTNVYAHDSKNDFLNWSIIDMGAFDYPADAWGYTYGASGEWTGEHSTLRAGLFQLSAVPNEIEVEHQAFRQYGSIVEFEQRTSLLGGHPGALKALVYADTGYMGAYANALATAAGSGNPPSTAAVRDDKHVKVGAGLNLAQEIAPNIGVFARLSAMNGTYEAYDFTEIDRSLSGGLSIHGNLYGRPNDAIGLAGDVDGLSQPAQAYFAAGGLGVLIGDGALAYGAEHILETYYKLGFTKNVALTLDFQRIVNPGYNTVRGPVSVLGLRYHVNF
jgi:high affinity Mn2+ porin